MFYRLLCFALLFAVSSGVHAAEDDNYASREDRAVLDMFFCRHPHAELGKDGCVVMRPEDARFRVSRDACAPGYEQVCDARDHGARPYQPYAGGR